MTERDAMAEARRIVADYSEGPFILQERIAHALRERDAEIKQLRVTLEMEAVLSSQQLEVIEGLRKERDSRLAELKRKGI